MMPRISGFEMLDILRNTDGLKNTKIIMLTALGQAEDKTRADSLGADRYLVKSQVTLEDIVKAADELLNPDAYTDEAKPEAAPATVAAAPMNDLPTASPEVAAVAHQQVPQAAPAEPTAFPAASSVPEPAPLPNPPPAADPAPVAAPVDQQVVAAAPAAEPTVPLPEPVNAAPVEPVAPIASEIPSIPVVETPPEGPEDGEANKPVIQMPSNPIEPDVAADTAAANVQSTSQEAATVEQQIENFVNTSAAAPLAATPETPKISPAASAAAPTTAPPAPRQSPEQLIETAANDLQNAQPQLYVSPNEVTGKKIISPIGSQGQPDIQSLVAEEEAREESMRVGGTVAPDPAATVAATAVEPDLEQLPPLPAPEATQPAAAQPPAPVAPAPANVPVAPAPETPAAAPVVGGVVSSNGGNIFTPNQNGSANEEAL
jgi:CheY-like chemotaxis protein